MGSPNLVFAKKLQALKNNLKKWNKEVFGNVLVKKVALKMISYWE